MMAATLRELTADFSRRPRLFQQASFRIWSGKVTVRPRAIAQIEAGSDMSQCLQRLYVLFREAEAFTRLEEAGMSTFDKREDAFENKFVHDETLRFKAKARRDKLLALWAAEKLGRTDLDAYVAEVLAADIEESGDEGVFLKIRKDFDTAGVARSDHQIRRAMDELMHRAMAEIKTTG